MFTHWIDNIENVVCRKARCPETWPELPAPEYHYRTGERVALAVASMKDHMTDEGWQIMEGLQRAGYRLCGHGLPTALTNVNSILDLINPAVVLMQDKREWDMAPRDFRDPQAAFTNVTALARRPDLFKLTVLKDSHQKPGYHRESAEEIGCHAWVVYYHPKIVKALAPYVRERHLIRTYHTVDPDLIPPFGQYERAGCLLSGAISDAYPLRQRLFRHAGHLPATAVLNHPGYHRKGCATPGFLKTLSSYKVAICTASSYGYALRKMIEATACGCVVITNLPSDEVLPGIDENLIRVPSGATVEYVGELIRQCIAKYDPERQRRVADLAKYIYDYRRVTANLLHDIDAMRKRYHADELQGFPSEHQRSSQR